MTTTKLETSLVAVYRNGWLWTEANRNQWRFKFGFPESGFNYSEWKQKPLTTNELELLVHDIVKHYEKLYQPEPYEV